MIDRLKSLAFGALTARNPSILTRCFASSAVLHTPIVIAESINMTR